MLVQTVLANSIYIVDASGGDYSASPVFADGKIYCLSEEGVTTIIEAGPKFKVLARNDLKDRCLASMAVSSGQLFIRSKEHVYCIGKPEK